MRCKVCTLAMKKRVQTEGMIRSGTPLRRISETLKKNGINISHGGIYRHASHTPRAMQPMNNESDDFIKSIQEFRPVRITVNIDAGIRKALAKKRRVIENRLKKSRYRRKATISSIVNYFLQKGVNAIASNRAEADRVLYDFMRQRALFMNPRKRRVRGRPLSTMISKELDRRLWVEVQGSVWVNRPYEELCELWNKIVQMIQGNIYDLPDRPSHTDYVNVALKAGLEL